MDIYQKLHILSDSAKYDVSCSSSGGENNFKKDAIGCNHTSGICHSYTSDGRCVSLLKVLFTNFCVYDCSYCVSRVSNDIQRAAFSPRELADLTINFYKRNYIEGLFLSSGIMQNEDYTMELLIRALEILRFEYNFNGYIHLKLIPNSSAHLIQKAIKLATRVSSNLELPSSHSLKLLAPQKTKQAVLSPLKTAKQLSLEKGGKPLSMSTQMIIGATPESDFDILKTSSVMYQNKLLNRVYYSAYIPISNEKNLPSIQTKPPLKRENRLYQADWLLRFYGFEYHEIVGDSQNLDLDFDPKTAWALQNLQHFPIEINRASKEELIRIPGIGIRGAHKIIKARAFGALGFEQLQRLGISMKRARYFITARGKYCGLKRFYPETIKQNLKKTQRKQLSFFDDATLWGEM